MKKLILQFFLFNTFLSFTYGQQYTCAVFPDENNDIQLSLIDYCGQNVQWQMSSISEPAWSNMQYATSNPYKFSIGTIQLDSLKFRAIVNYNQEGNLDTSITFKIQLIDDIKDIKIGNMYNGVFIYYQEIDTFLGFQYFHEKARWGCMGKILPGSNKRAIFDGIQNTIDIVHECKDSSIAANICYNSHLCNMRDWYLPSVDELMKILALVDSLDYDYYNPFHGFWTSTQHNTDRAIYSGTFLAGDKNRELNIIASHLIDSSIISSNCRIMLGPIERHQYIETNVVDSSYTKFEANYRGEFYDSMSYNWNPNTGGYIYESLGQTIKTVYDKGKAKRIKLIISNDGCKMPYFYSNEIKPQFFNKIESNLPAVYDGNFKWIDINNDGFQDIIVTGSNMGVIYLNQDGDTLIRSSIEIKKLDNTSCDVGDFNNDGYCDFILSGYNKDDSVCYTTLYINDRGNDFKESQIPIPGLNFGNMSWIDVNNDGFIDLFMSGQLNNGNNFAQLYENQNGKNLIIKKIQFDSLRYSSSAWGDYNLDGFPDLIYSGIHDTILKTLFYENIQGQLYKKEHPFHPIYDGDIEWVDIDNDGYLDVFMSGFKQYPLIRFNSLGQLVVSTISRTFNHGYKNQIDSFISFWGFPMERSVCRSSLFLTDFDQDGYSDLFITGTGAFTSAVSGTGGGDPLSQVDDVLRNTKTSIFKNLSGNDFYNIWADIPIKFSSLGHQTNHGSYSYACKLIEGADFNRDGNIDFIREGSKQKYKSEVYINLNEQKNQSPLYPYRIFTEIECDTVFLTWSHATDDHTPSQVLAYDIYIGSAPNKCDIVSKVNDYNLQDTFFILNRSLPEGTYYWSVRTKDNAKVFSDWAPEQSFTIDLPTAPEIWAEGDTLYSNIDSGNQWYDESGPIAGATDPSYVITQSGSYYNIVTQDGCSSDTSNVLEMFLSSAKTPEWAEQLRVFPNPFDDKIFMQFDGIQSPIRYKISNALGQAIENGIMIETTSINTAAWSNGIYNVTLIYENAQITKQVLKH